MSFEDILDIPGLHAQYRRRRSRALARRIGMAILSLIAVAAIGFPIVAQYRTAQDLETVASHAATPVAGWSEERIDAAFAAARAYNRRLAGQASAEPDVSDLVGASETALPGDSSGVIPSAAGSSAASPSSGASSAGACGAATTLAAESSAFFVRRTRFPGSSPVETETAASGEVSSSWLMRSRPSPNPS